MSKQKTLWPDDLINRLIRYPRAIAMRFRSLRLRLLGMQIGQRCWIQKISVPRNPWDITIGDNCALDEGAILLTTGSRISPPRLRLGSSSYVNRYTMFDASEEIVIGNYCMIGPFCYITDHDHASKVGEKIAAQSLTSAPVRVGNNVWIGAGLTTGLMITTRNRAAELQRTCEALRRLNPAPVEILITADACSDATVDVVKSILPQARIFVNENPQGSIASRDRMIRESTADLVLSLDDDSYPN